MKTFHCDHCNQQVFFENVVCERCGYMLGFLVDLGEISAFEPDGNGFWRSLDANTGGRSYTQCHNYAVERVCNRMIPLDDADPLCQSCQLTTVIPSMHSDRNRTLWYRLESAKRRLLYALWGLGLPVVSHQVDPETGLSFEFKETTNSEPEIHTGHSDGVITVNIAEADDAYRAKVRAQMKEPYRTLLGHFRHEIGHYYFMRLMHDGPQLDRCRELFGDDRQNYGAALQRHYEQGPPPNWEASYISSYASTHPYEDWAETWAHYLHMIATLETADACGLSLAPGHPDEPSMEADTDDEVNLSFNEMIDRWFSLTYVLNNLNRSMGLQDAYPFTLPQPVIDKLRVIHRVIRTNSQLPQ